MSVPLSWWGLPSQEARPRYRSHCPCCCVALGCGGPHDRAELGACLREHECSGQEVGEGVQSHRSRHMGCAGGMPAPQGRRGRPGSEAPWDLGLGERLIQIQPALWRNSRGVLVHQGTRTWRQGGG